MASALQIRDAAYTIDRLERETAHLANSIKELAHGLKEALEENKRLTMRLERIRIAANDLPDGSIKNDILRWFAPSSE